MVSNIQTRAKMLNQENINNGKYVLYWMQASQRAEYNHALEYGIYKANKINKPLVVFFGITNSYPEANKRHYYFMLEGLKEVEKDLKKKGIKLVIQNISPEIGVVKLAKFASLVVVDRAYTKNERKWIKYVKEMIKCPFVQVESNVIVPIETISSKEEYSAATFRPKIKKILNQYLVPMKYQTIKKQSIDLDIPIFDIEDLRKAISKLKVSNNIEKSKIFIGGSSKSRIFLKNFIEKKLDEYSDDKNDPTKQCVSNMSPYLHFGQISPLEIALNILVTDSPSMNSYLDELIVRRELAANFVFFNPHYDSFDGLNEWQKRTLNEHRADKRDYLYTLEKFERAETHDPYWNGAQKEMMINGKMHGYMRMYWGKKIIEWTKTPQEAYKIALYLNNKYELDGRDPNGFAGIAWCFGKHDRPWKERAIFGKIRYMNDKGLRRKFDADGYVKMISKL